MYFDANGNGDLTDDKPTAATEVTGPTATVSQSQFPRVDVSLDVDGTSVDYSFLISSMSQQTPGRSYTTVSLYAAAVREGYITQGKKLTRVVLVDHNSNGRFDDAAAVRSRSTVVMGDLLLVNPNSKDQLSADATMARDRYFVGKTGVHRQALLPDGSQPGGRLAETSIPASSAWATPSVRGPRSALPC